ncbi:histidyl-tRNA synthetase [Guillardia theta CCMP2712]|uniref:histidine--tRNA ligase n=1 Tax=Guillardia theta (strain CCMP2712) TaxID=905079 RepID=L1K406_GUITC|nr:histidyl-tRNA synthetase [Guillardia theta CCMP2712]EKX55561.1 histidyl-tRNA synthetase [Guillardia theta CCMP2712]|eukprot:XP_005842541.1 histidyl-tRNA synthetase [Guillardia theta CCMP2712]
MLSRQSTRSFSVSMSGTSQGRASAAVAQSKEKSTGKKEKLDLKPPKGTRDFYPEDMRMRNWLFGHWKDVARLHGFEEYDAPVLESEELYIRKAGEEVTQQLYNFEDKGERRVSLRPEMTPSLARMVMARGKSLTLPVKWFSIPQCWRYERMTRGRRREHYQWNMDIWGVPGIEAEAELLSAIVTFFKRVGITSQDVGIKVNSRAVLSEVLTAMGVPADKFAATCVLVDKLEKVKLDDIRGEMQELGLTDEIITKLVATLSIKDLDALEQTLGNGSKALAQLKQLMEYAEAYGFRDWLIFDASVVRGLAYYTGVVFEGFDRKGELRAICGGGRYDELLATFGGEPLPAVGFGFGDAVIAELLKDRNLLPNFDNNKEDKKMKWAFKHAERLGASHLVIIGEDEIAKGIVQVKNLAKGEQVEVEVSKVSDFIAEQLASS